MSAPQFTPGPWWVDDRRKTANGIKSGAALQVQAAHRGPGSSYCVATVQQWEVPEANARLIAAAPELYEALEKTTARCAQYADHIRDFVKADDLEAHPYLPQLDGEVADAIAALAKARGEQ